MMQDHTTSTAGSGSGIGVVTCDGYAESRATTGVSNRRPYEKSSSFRKKRHQGDAAASITSTTPFIVLLTLLAVAMAIQFMIVFSWHHKRHNEHVLGNKRYDEHVALSNVGRFDKRSTLAENDDNVKEPVKKSYPVEAALAQQYRPQPKVPAKKTTRIYHNTESLTKANAKTSDAKTHHYQEAKHPVKTTSHHISVKAVAKETKISAKENHHRHTYHEVKSLDLEHNAAKDEDGEEIRPEWNDNRYSAKETGTKDEDDEMEELEDFEEENLDRDGEDGDDTLDQANEKDPAMAHLVPHLPPLPPILNTRKIRNQKELISDTLSGRHPTIAGIALILARFLTALHNSNNKLASHATPPTRNEVHERFVKLAQKYLAPFEATYRDKPIFPIRDDDSIFVSLASFRDHLLGDTLKGAFDQAKFPDKLYIGAIVQNCLGLNPYEGEPGVQCRTGAQVVGRDKHGHDFTKVSDAPPDRNGIEEFCTSDNYKQYCENGQIRVFYLHEAESLGPAMARYYASKLWGGESYFMQVDAHLEFYKHWDELYTNELKSTNSFPSAVLSSYPPGFQAENGGILEGQPSLGTRLCSCTFSESDVESQIIRINTGVGYNGDEDHPTQIPFIAAGFFFTTAEFLADVPFDPYMPWCFMGEEIMLSMRAWTHGWDIYAPRHNWIAHQYRPGRMGLPKFWGSVGRLFGKPGPGFSNQLQLRVSVCF